MSNRPEVIEALVAAHDADEPTAQLVALEFVYDPPPTDAERAVARRQVVAERERGLQRVIDEVRAWKTGASA